MFCRPEPFYDPLFFPNDDHSSEAKASFWDRVSNIRRRSPKNPKGIQRVRRFYLNACFVIMMCVCLLGMSSDLFD